MRSSTCYLLNYIYLSSHRLKDMSPYEENERFLCWGSLLGAGLAEKYVVYGHRVPSEEPKELVLWIHANLLCIKSHPAENLWMSCSHHYYYFFSWREVKEVEKGTIVFLQSCFLLFREGLDFLKMWEEGIYQLPIILWGLRFCQIRVQFI